MFNNIAIIGNSGAIGSAFTKHLSKLDSNITIHAFSRNNNELKDVPTLARPHQGYLRGYP